MAIEISEHVPKGGESMSKHEKFVHMGPSS